MAFDTIRIVRIGDHSFLAAPINRGSCVVDLGVNTGQFATAMIENFGCSVVGLEPAPELFASLPAIEGLTVDPLAITPYGEPATLHINSSSTAATIDRRLSKPGVPTVSVEGITLAGVLDRHGLERSQLVKVDIEGAEIPMLANATMQTLQRVDQFTIEFHDSLDREMAADVRQVKRRLRSAGFAELSLSRDNSDVLFVNRSTIPFDALRRAAAALAYKYPRGIAGKIQRTMYSAATGWCRGPGRSLRAVTWAARAQQSESSPMASRDPFRYGGPWFSAAASLPLRGDPGDPRHLTRVVAAAVLQPQRVVALTVLALRTRLLCVYPSESPSGQALRTYLDRRILGFPQNRLFRGVLLLPRHHSVYLRGRRRQALRTNLRRAARAGIRCEEMTDRSLALIAAREVLDQRRALLSIGHLAGLPPEWPSDLFAQPHVRVMVARDADGHALAFLAASIDDQACLISSAVACSHEARWALHDHLVQVLIAYGVRYLLAEGGGPFGALGLDGEVRHYQHLLGYELRHLVLRDHAPDRTPNCRWRRQPHSRSGLRR